MKEVIPDWIISLLKELGYTEEQIKDIRAAYIDKCPIPKRYGVRLVKNVAAETAISLLLELKENFKI